MSLYIKTEKSRFLSESFQGATKVEVNHDCSILTVISPDETNIVNLINFTREITIKRNHAYPIRLDYHVLIHPASTELILQVNDQGNYFEERVE